MGATAGVGAWGGGWSARMVAAGEWGWALGGLCAGDRRGWVVLAGCALAALALSGGGGGLARVPPAGGDSVVSAVGEPWVLAGLRVRGRRGLEVVVAGWPGGWWCSSSQVG